MCGGVGGVWMESTGCHDGDDGDDDVSLLLTFSV